MDQKIEIMAPAGNWESLSAALRAGADSVYFGVGDLNMRSRSTANFGVEDLRHIVKLCRAARAKAYLTLNVILYDEEMGKMQELCDGAKKAGVDAIIASDIAVIQYAHSIALPVHMSVQANVCNKSAVKFFAQYAEVMVLARELTLSQIQGIIQYIKEEDLRGPTGEPIRIEIFAHGALCIAVSGKCHMSLTSYNASANRGACLQNCRRAYKVTDADTGYELEIDNKYVMSPKDLCTIRVMDQLIEAGVSVFKLEGRGRAADYVYTVTSTYKQAAQEYLDGEWTAEKVEEHEKRLQSVFNRGFWQGGYYLGVPWNEWSGSSNSRATELKVHAGRVTKFFVQSQVAELNLEARALSVGDELVICGPTTGALRVSIAEIRTELNGETVPVQTAEKNALAYISVPARVRKNDRVYLLKARSLTAMGEKGHFE